MACSVRVALRVDGEGGREVTLTRQLKCEGWARRLSSGEHSDDSQPRAASKAP